jgi:hypothetical protein
VNLCTAYPLAVGRPPVDSEDVHVRLRRSALDALDAWIAAHPEPRPSRPEAIPTGCSPKLSIVG